MERINSRMLQQLIVAMLLQVAIGQSTRFPDYNLMYRVRIIDSGDNRQLFDQCQIASVPNEDSIAKESIDISFDPLYYKKGFSLCSVPQSPFENSPAIVIDQTDQCGLIRQIRNARSANFKIVVFVSSKGQDVLPFLKEEFRKFPIVILLQREYFNKISHSLTNAKIGIYGSMGDNRAGDILTACILFSLIICSIGLLVLLAIVFHREHFTKFEQPDISDAKNMKWMVVIIPIIMIGSLMLLYFFYNVLVWVLMIMFYFAVAFSIMSFGMLFVMKFNIRPKWIYPFNKIGIKNLDLRAIGLFVLGLIVSTAWIITRKNMAGLVLNNLIGIIICAEIAMGFGLLFVVSKLFRLLLLLLSIVVVIDVCMVYIPAPGGQPYSSNQVLAFKANDTLSRFRRDAGDSIMERVATGAAGDSKEEVPIRFKIPRVNMNYKMSSAACQNPMKSYSMVGFGDVILPGAFIAFILTFAVASKNSVTLYALFMMFWYIVGLIITFVVVTITERGQPALVYLVPCTVISTLALCALKKDLMSLWHHTWRIDVAERLRDSDEPCVPARSEES